MNQNQREGAMATDKPEYPNLLHADNFDDRYDDEVTDAHLDAIEAALAPHRPAQIPRFNRKK